MRLRRNVNGKHFFSLLSLSKSICVALCVLYKPLIQPLNGFIDILDYAKQPILEWVSMINDLLLGKVQLRRVDHNR